MAAPKVFVTGITGYIGGDAFYELFSRHPDWDYAVMVRGTERGAQVARQYPNVRLVYGSNQDTSILESESAKADIVIHTAEAADDEGAAKAIAKGLADGHSPDKPGFWLHTSGTGILTWADMRAERYGEPDDKVYNDLEGVDELTNLPDDALHRNVDKVVIGAAEMHKESVKVAIVCPPTIYGPGRGPVNQRSRQIEALARITMDIKKAPKIGKGLARWNFVHVQDLAVLFSLLAEAAAAGNIQPELWGAKNGYYLAESADHAWGEVSSWVAEAAVDQGHIATPELTLLDAHIAAEIAGYNGLSWGLNSRGEAKRARKLLGWSPLGPSVKEEIPAIVQFVAQSTV
jgi:nucleoside-diphosphate-sugar epimerase